MVRRKLRVTSFPMVTILALIAAAASALAAWFSYLYQRNSHIFTLRPDLHLVGWEIKSIDDLQGTDRYVFSMLEPSMSLAGLITIETIENSGPGAASEVLIYPRTQGGSDTSEWTLHYQHDEKVVIRSGEKKPLGIIAGLYGRDQASFMAALPINLRFIVESRDELGNEYRTIYFLTLFDPEEMTISSGESVCPGLKLNARSVQFRSEYYTRFERWLGSIKFRLQQLLTKFRNFAAAVQRRCVLL